jgi:hypothetical protein
MPKAKNATTFGSRDEGRPLAVPLDVAAQVLGRPLPELERADVEPYQHADGHPVWSLRALAKALSLPVEPVTRSRAAS